MSKFILKPIDPTNVPTPEVGLATLFLDINDGLFKKKNDGGDISLLENPSFTKVTKEYTDFQPDGTVDNSILVVNIPDGDHLVEMVIKQITPPSGGSISATAVILEDNSGNQMLPDNSLFGSFLIIGASGSTLKIKVTVTGGVINDLTAGEWDIYYRFLSTLIV